MNGEDSHAVESHGASSNDRAYACFGELNPEYRCDDTKSSLPCILIRSGSVTSRMFLFFLALYIQLTAMTAKELHLNQQVAVRSVDCFFLP